MDEDRLARMYEAARLTGQAGLAEAPRRTGQARLAEATALLQRRSEGADGASRLPDLQALLSRLPRSFGRMPSPVTNRRPGPVAPGRFLELSYANAAGERSYKLYVPTTAAGQTAP